MSKYFDTQNLSFMAPELKEHGSHMVMTNVHKDVKTKYVNIDTRFQEDYFDEMYADVKIKLPQTITNVQSMKVTNLELVASFYNFSLQRKNTYFVIENSTGVRMLILIDDGNYTLASLATEIENKMKSSTIGITDITTSVNNDAQKIEFSSTGSNAYIFHFDVDEYGNTDKTNFKSKLGWTLGFRSTTYELAAAGEIYSETFINLHSHRYLYFVVDEFSQTNPNSFLAPSFNSYLKQNILARIALDSNTYEFGSIICVSNSGGKLLSDKRTYNGKTDIQRLHVQLLDETGNLVDLNKTDFSFALEIEYL